MVLSAEVLNRLLDRYLYLINETYRVSVINACRGWLGNLSSLESDTKKSALTKLAICSPSILEKRKWGHMRFPIIISKHYQGWKGTWGWDDITHTAHTHTHCGHLVLVLLSAFTIALLVSQYHLSTHTRLLRYIHEAFHKLHLKLHTKYVLHLMKNALLTINACMNFGSMKIIRTYYTMF